MKVAVRSRDTCPTARLRGRRECERMQWLPLESTAGEKCVAEKEREDNMKGKGRSCRGFC